MRLVYIILGFLSLLIGMIGIILPILPTTPFVLLTVYLFARGSQRFHHWFIQTKIYKTYLSDFVEQRSMKRKDKWRLMIMVDVILLITIFMIQQWIITVILIIIDCIKYWYFFTQVKTIN
jgi:hypothetical protein